MRYTGWKTADLPLARPGSGQNRDRACPARCIGLPALMNGCARSSARRHTPGMTRIELPTFGNTDAQGSRMTSHPAGNQWASPESTAELTGIDLFQPPSGGAEMRLRLRMRMPNRIRTLLQAGAERLGEVRGGRVPGRRNQTPARGGEHAVDHTRRRRRLRGMAAGVVAVALVIGRGWRRPVVPGPS